MIVFLNEASMDVHADWAAGLKFFLDAAKELSGKAALFKDDDYFFCASFKQRFGVSVASASPEVRAQIKQLVFSERYCKHWRPIRISSPTDVFTCQCRNASVSDDSSCEAAELKQLKSDSNIGMLSASPSAFTGRQTITLMKQGSQSPLSLSNAEDLPSIRAWIVQRSGHYDPSSYEAPKDFQTILEKDTSRFRRTNHFWNVAGKDRRIYEEIATSRQFYVDEGHPGPSAHLEVCDANGNHLGEADIHTGTLDPQKKVPGRYITR